MEILIGKNYPEFLAFLREIKSSLAEWQLADISLADGSDAGFTIQSVGDLLLSHFKGREGKVYICNERELLMLIRQDKPNRALLAAQVETALPKGKCAVRVDHPSAENLTKLAISVKFEKKPAAGADMAGKRKARGENIILIADDDLYMRTLIKKGVDPRFTVQEVIHGSEILTAYKKYSPDILFLDIHMPGKGGMESLQEILAYDPQAYVVMLSSDSSQENVVNAAKQGAKGFLAKPFPKDRLLDYVKKCPTIV